MNVADELKKLQQLHESGALSDEEFTKAKQAVLDSAQAGLTGSSEGEGMIENLSGGRQQTFGRAAHRYVNFQIVMTIAALLVTAIIAFAVILLANRAEEKHEQFQKEFNLK